MDGILLVDKPPNISSFAVVHKIRKRFSLKKVGHGGTLDPFATGVLIILIGKGTKLFDVLVSTDKKYSGTMHLGAITDTQDCTGSILEERDYDALSAELIKNVFCQYQGHLQQIPPMVSALHHKGKRLYELARQGLEVERKARSIDIYSFITTRIDVPLVAFSVHCSKGTYVRTLCHDVGLSLGSGAHLSVLRRDGSGPFLIKNAVPLNVLLNLDKDKFVEKIIHSDEAVKMCEEYERLLFNRRSTTLN